ncbi:hypothetical protein AMTR_s00100p00110330 [Amborella trichopoda]|uniref:Uncharacterized protein n=1 Tax=Amborella trichopoda TaxID=13333 RepID=W1NYQ4_AMBTC|nr:hypothetical protein AMTR_s00100p00110330 [Amborella trichopoda]
MAEFAELNTLAEDLVHEVQRSGRSSNTSSNHKENSSVADENPFTQTVDGRHESAIERLAKAMEGDVRNIRVDIEGFSAYQLASKAEQKLKRLSYQLERGKPSKVSKGKIVIGTPQNTSLHSPQVANKDNANTSKATTSRNPSNTCFRYGEMRHKAFEYPKKKLHLLDPMGEEEVDEPELMATRISFPLK